MDIAFEQVDVFTDRPFAGNPLCVVPDARGLTPEQMQAIAQEMNLSETTFVLPPTDPKADYWMRIFTPAKEIPFAGHPSIGTAFVMASQGRILLREPVTRIHQQVGIGTLPLDIEATHRQPSRIVMTQGAPAFGGAIRDVAPVAEVLGIRPDVLAASPLPIQAVSTELFHLMVPLPDLGALAALKPNPPALERVLIAAGALGCYPFTLETGTPEVAARARMFAPGAGVSEDPATGSAVGPLGAYLAVHGALPRERRTLVVEQGVEMGRPSRMWVEIERDATGMPVAVRVGGSAVPVVSGTIHLP